MNILTGTVSDVGEVLGRGNYGANGTGSLVLRVAFLGDSESLRVTNHQLKMKHAGQTPPWKHK